MPVRLLTYVYTRRSVNPHSPSNFQPATMSSPFSINPLMTTRNIPPLHPGLSNFPWLPFNLLASERQRENRSKKFMKSTSKSLKNRFNFLNGIRIHLHNSLFYPTIRFLFAPLSNGSRSTDTLRDLCIETNSESTFPLEILYRLLCRIIFYHAHDSNRPKAKPNAVSSCFSSWVCRKINESMIAMSKSSRTVFRNFLPKLTERFETKQKEQLTTYT